MEPAAHIYYTTFPAFEFQTCLEIVKSQPGSNYAQFPVSRGALFQNIQNICKLSDKQQQVSFRPINSGSPLNIEATAAAAHLLLSFNAGAPEY